MKLNPRMKGITPRLTGAGARSAQAGLRKLTQTALLLSDQ